jgi:hypothetical protein
VAGFSHGERTKVALARALVHDPQNVLLDEPTNGLDVMSTRAVRQVFRELRSEGRCVLFSSHVMQKSQPLRSRSSDGARPGRRRRKPGRTAHPDRDKHSGGRVRPPCRTARRSGLNLNRMLSVTTKELTDGFRDRRALYTILFSTLVGPLLMGGMSAGWQARRRQHRYSDPRRRARVRSCPGRVA